jgi:hypothetical protein
MTTYTSGRPMLCRGLDYSFRIEKAFILVPGKILGLFLIIPED